MTASAESASAVRRRLPRPTGAGAAWLGFYALVLAAWAAAFLMDPAAGLPEGAEAFGAAWWRDLCAAAARDARLPGLVRPVGVGARLLRSRRQGRWSCAGPWR